MSVSPRLAILALLLLVVPALVTGLFLANTLRLGVRDGAQPGGVVRGRLVPFTAAPDEVRLGGLAVDLVGIGTEGAATLLATAATGDDGRFEIAAPAIEGHYELRAGGGAWQRGIQPLSLIGGAPDEVTFALLPAARIEVAIERRDGRPVRGGEWTLEVEAQSRWFSPWIPAQTPRRGTFEGSEFTVDGLPEARVLVLVRLDTGERVELLLDLAAGVSRHTVRV